MKTASILKDLKYNEEKPAVQVLLETGHSKEIRIAMKKGQVMKENTTPYPIVVEIFDGSVNFGVYGGTYFVRRGDMLSLQGNIPHNLTAEEDSIVTLTLSKGDNVERVRGVADRS